MSKYLKVVTLFCSSIIMAQTNPQLSNNLPKAEEAVLAELRNMREELINSDPSKSKFVISSDIPVVSNVQESVIGAIDSRKESIRNIIYETAKDIENNLPFNVKWDIQIRKHKVPTEVESFYNAVKDNNISLKSMKLSIDLLVDISKNLYDGALKEKDPDKKAELYIEYTCFAYELSDVVIGILEDFTPKGENQIEQEFDKQKSKVDEIKGKIQLRVENYRQRYKSGVLTKEQFEEKEMSFDEMITVLEGSLDKWNILFDKLREQDEWAKELQTKSKIFIDLKEDAAIQLDVLSVLKSTMVVIQNFQTIEQITDVADIPLLPVDINLLNDLFQTNISVGENSKL